MASMLHKTWTNCYEILSISPTADIKDINSAYKKLALKHHPDKTGADDAHIEFQKVRDTEPTTFPLPCLTTFLPFPHLANNSPSLTKPKDS
jgi:hypothetical protein